MSVKATGTTEWTEVRQKLLSRQSMLGELGGLIDWTSTLVSKEQFQQDLGLTREASQKRMAEWGALCIMRNGLGTSGKKSMESAISILEKINSGISKDARYKTIANIFTSSLKFLRALSLAQKGGLSVLGGKIQATNQQEGQRLVLPEVVLNIPFVIKSLSEILDSETRGNEKPSKDRWSVLQKGNFEARLVFRAQEGASLIFLLQHVENRDPSETNECKSGRDTSSASKKEEKNGRSLQIQTSVVHTDENIPTVLPSGERLADVKKVIEVLKAEE